MIMTLNEENNNSKLNHTELIVLGLIAEEPSHAYNLNKKIEERNMRNWTNIGRSSIYRVMKKFEKKNLAKKWVEEVDNRIVKIYKITDLGFKILKTNVFKIISEYYGKNDEDFYVAFSMLPILTEVQQIKAFTSALIKMKNHKKELESMLNEYSELPLNVKGLFLHPIKILETDIEFFNFIIKEIKKGE